MGAARFQLYRQGTGGVLWRYIAGNNRELGRAVVAQPDEGDALALLVELRAELRSTRRLVYLDSTGRWRWDLRVAGARRAQSSRGYHRRIECEATLSQFLLTSPAAEVLTGVASFPPARRLVNVPEQPRVARQRSRRANERDDRIDRTAAFLHVPDMRRTPARSRVAD